MDTRANGGERYERLLRAAQNLPPVTTAVAHPCDQISLEGVVEAAGLGLIAPILVAPPARIRDIAKQAGLDISRFPLRIGAQPRFRRQGGRTCPRGQGRGPDEGQPAYG